MLVHAYYEMGEEDKIITMCKNLIKINEDRYKGLLLKPELDQDTLLIAQDPGK